MVLDNLIIIKITKKRGKNIMSLPAELLNMVFVEELKATPPEIEKMLGNYSAI